MQGKNKTAQLFEADSALQVVETQIPEPQDGEVLIKVQASTINPSDRYFLKGVYGPLNYPVNGGKQGTGHVIKAQGETVQSWIGKRVVFNTPKGGAWGYYIATKTDQVFEIDNDVPLSSAASGVVNPLTVLGFINTFKSLGARGKGLIHTAAASFLGKQLLRIAKSEGIPILNIVRRKQQEQILRNQGAEHVLVTEGNWEQQYKKLLQTQKFNTVFDALGGGPVTQVLVSNLLPGSQYFAYGTLENKPFTLPNIRVLFPGVTIGAFFLPVWWRDASNETKEEIRKNYSSYLKGPLSTATYKELPLESINEALSLSVEKASEGKILVRIQ